MILCHIFSQKISGYRNRPPKSDFITYCSDLAKLESAYLHTEYFTTQIGFSFSEMFDHAIAPYTKILDALQKAEYCVIAHAQPEYDPDYSHVGVYLKNRYAFAGEMVDVITQRGSERKIALHLMFRFFEMKKIMRGAVLIFEQGVIPVSKDPLAVCHDEHCVEVWLFHVQSSSVIVRVHKKGAIL